MALPRFSERRTETPDPGVLASSAGGRLGVIGVMAAVATAILLAVLMGTDEDPTRHFDEGGLITILSFLALLSAAALAGLCYWQHPRPDASDRWLWAFISVGFVFFAADEVLQGHERFGTFLDDHVLGVPGLLRSWNDVIVMGYGLIGLAVLIWFRGEVLRWPGVLKLLVVGLGFFVVHTAIDSLTDSALKDYPEESAKLFANAFFALAMATAWRGIRAARGKPAPSTTDREV